MKIEAITVCSGYADFLAETLPHVVHQFDRFLVVTSYGDRETQRLCRELSVECRPTDLLEKGGLVQADQDKVFSKGRAIDWGLGYLERCDWVCHIDADIYLPPGARRLIEAARPDPRCIYGIDRVNCVGYEKWRQYQADPARAHPLRHHCLLVPPPFPLGARLVLPEHEGYVPIGFFQLWHGSHGRRYPLRQGSAEHTDVLHALQWPRDKRRLLPEVVAVHLESEPARMGANWSGRTTAPFGPKKAAGGCVPAGASADASAGLEYVH